MVALTLLYFIALYSLVAAQPLVIRDTDSSWSPSTIAAEIGQELMLSFASKLLTLGVPMKIIDEYYPRWSIDLICGALTATNPTFLLPGYNTHFAPSTSEDTDRIRWFTQANDRRPDDPVIFYLHGGGYGWGLSPVHGQLLWELSRKINTNRLSILWLDYTLSSSGTFPDQLRELVSDYNRLQMNSNNIIAFGDSAGVHLWYTLMRHAAVPYDNVPPVQNVNKTKAAAFVSPWSVFDVTSSYASSSEFADLDSVNSKMLYEWAQLFVNNRTSAMESPSLNMAIDQIDWSHILPDPSNIFVSYGQFEILRSATEDWIRNAGLNPNISTIYMEPLGTHDTLTSNVTTSKVFDPLVAFLRSYIYR